MFPDNLYISDPTSGLTYILENDQVSRSFVTHNGVYSYLIAQNMQEVYTVNRNMNSVTRYVNLQSIGDIKVGTNPWGICEDPTGRIYVTNYGDGTVSIIENGAVTGKVAVDNGPRGIVSDPNGIVYVACYISNTVCKLVNNVLVERITVPYNPEGITCSPTGEVWVTCSGSNVVVKLMKNGTHLTVDTGKCPVAVVCDRRGNVFTANFEDDTVSMISTVNKNKVTTIAVGDGPSALAINSQGFVYVTSNLSGEKLYKINPKNGLVIGQIEVCKGQSAFGDFTGCATYNCFNPTGGAMSGSIPDAIVGGVIQALNPTFTVTTFDEKSDGTYAIKVGSDMFDLSKFSRLTLNGVSTVDESGAYILEGNELGSNLTLVGYLSEDDGNPVTFTSIPVASLFQVVVGIVNEDYGNWVELNRSVIDFTKSQVSSLIAKQPSKGYLLLFVPNRVYSLVKDGIVVQGMQDIATAWSKPADLSDEDYQSTLTAISAGIPAELREKYQILNNWLLTNANENWLFQFFKVS